MMVKLLLICTMKWIGNIIVTFRIIWLKSLYKKLIDHKISVCVLKKSKYWSFKDSYSERFAFIL